MKRRGKRKQFRGGRVKVNDKDELPGKKENTSRCFLLFLGISLLSKQITRIYTILCVRILILITDISVLREHRTTVEW